MKKYGFTFKLKKLPDCSGSLYDIIFTKRYKTAKGLLDGLKWIERNPDYVIVKIIKSMKN